MCSHAGAPERWLMGKGRAGGIPRRVVRLWKKVARVRPKIMDGGSIFAGGIKASGSRRTIPNDLSFFGSSVSLLISVGS